MMRLPHLAHLVPYLVPYLFGRNRLVSFRLPYLPHLLARTYTYAHTHARARTHLMYLCRTYRTCRT